MGTPQVTEVIVDAKLWAKICGALTITSEDVGTFFKRSVNVERGGTAKSSPEAKRKQELKKVAETDKVGPKADDKTKSKADDPDYSWRYHDVASTVQNVPIPGVDYYIPAREVGYANKESPSKSGPWGIDCYSLGRLLYKIQREDKEDKNKITTVSERVEAAENARQVVDFLKVVGKALWCPELNEAEAFGGSAVWERCMWKAVNDKRMVHAFSCLPRKAALQLEGWAKAPPYAFKCSDSSIFDGHIVEANSIQLLRAFLRQIRTVMFALAFDLMANLMRPVNASKIQADFVKPSIPCSKVKNSKLEPLQVRCSPYKPAPGSAAATPGPSGTSIGRSTSGINAAANEDAARTPAAHPSGSGAGPSASEEDSVRPQGLAARHLNILRASRDRGALDVRVSVEDLAGSLRAFHVATDQLKADYRARHLPASSSTLPPSPDPEPPCEDHERMMHDLLKSDTMLHFSGVAERKEGGVDYSSILFDQINQMGLSYDPSD